MTQNQNFLGSRWWKFDFHTHTPKSKDYGHGNKSYCDISATEWLQKVMESELDCVVVTDHNSGEWIDELKSKYKELQGSNIKPEWFRDVTIFPGVEITVANSCNRIHLLAVFDPDFGSQNVTAFLGSCGIFLGHGDDQNTSTKTSFVETVRNINEAGGIAIPAHIDGPKGLLEGIKSLTHELEKSLKEVFAAEFCDIHKFDNADPILKRVVDRLAKVAGSDAHKPEDIGKHFTWLKMSSPSIQGLRLALLDHKFCVKNVPENPNYLPNIFLSKLTVKNMHHCGRINGNPLVIQWHPRFNSVIGGRGTGKSTILESIRIVSRYDLNLEKEAPRVKDDLVKFMQLWKNKGVMHEDTEILMEIYRRGKMYQLRWRYDVQGAVLEEENNGFWQEIESGELSELRERFPVSIFSQKQINELASNPRGLLAVIDRSSEVNRLEWKSRWDSAKSQFLQLSERKRELNRQLDGEPQIRAKLSDVENDLKQYDEQGHGEVLKQYQKRSLQKNSLSVDQVFDDFSSGIRELAAGIGLADFPSHLFDEQDETAVEIKSIHDKTVQQLKKVGETLNQLANSVDELKIQRNKAISSSKWNEAVQSSIAAYERLVTEYETKKCQLSISLYRDWVQQRNQLQQQLKNLDSVRKECLSTDKQIKEALAKLHELRIELFNKRINFLKKVIGNNAFVRMDLVQYGDVNTLEDEYRSLLNLEEGKFISSVCDQENKQGILWDLNEWEENGTPESDLPKLISEIKSKTRGIVDGKDQSTHGSFAFKNRLQKLYETQPAIFDQLDAWWPEDMLRVRYAKDPSSGKFEVLEKGSAGQKAAAILAFLLSHGDEPLIIDQPEDDLDNALIYDLIVHQIHENKERRQLIIVTHNPNIVVNGDSELVHVMKYKGGQVQIDKQGGLEESDIREAICTIMEGGRQAFENRYNRLAQEV